MKYNIKGVSLQITEEEKNPKTRRYCHSCKSKRYIQNMVKVYYPLLGEAFWFCTDCFNTRESNIIIQEGILPQIKEID